MRLKITIIVSASRSIWRGRQNEKQSEHVNKALIQKVWSLLQCVLDKNEYTRSYNSSQTSNSNNNNSRHKAEMEQKGKKQSFAFNQKVCHDTQRTTKRNFKTVLHTERAQCI